MSEPTKKAPEAYASVHLSDPTQLAEFIGKVRGAEQLGYRVTLQEWRNGMDGLHGIVASVQAPHE